MKAIVVTSYGTPDVLQLQTVEKPAPKRNEVLIRVHAVSASPSDCAFRMGDPFIVKLIYGLRRPKYSIFGVELAGEIEQVGEDVTLFKQGDRVMGLSPDTFGGYAEYKCLPETGLLLTLPPSMTYEEAVGMCDGAPTSLTFLRDVAHVQRGQKVLINGASGAVGAYAVQLAKHFGAVVTGVCSANNVAMVKALGADQVIDYTTQDFTNNGETYDVIFDAVGKRSFAECKGSLTRQGMYLNTVPTLSIVLNILLTAKSSGKKARFVPAGLMQKKANLTFLTELFEQGQLKAVIDRCYPLEQTAEAHRYVETGHKKGNVVLTV
jgi:NADPH:quinone reductase-like Zn-dependent oxidoreductase